MNEFSEEFYGDIFPSLASDTIGFSADIEERVESIVEMAADSTFEFRDYDEDHYEYAESLGGDMEDDDLDFDDEELPTPNDGDIFDATFDLPKWPPAIPKPPGKFPGGPHPPKRPHHPPPKRPKMPHWPHHPHGACPHFKHLNDTIYEFLANSTHHKILYKLIKNDSSLIDIFNATGKDGKITLFAPTDHAFEKILKHVPKDHPHPPKWLLKKLIEYHTSGSFYPSRRLLAHRTIPTLFKAHHGPNLTQKIRIGAGIKGVNINFYAHPVFLDVFTSNGVVHSIDNLLLPPPPTYLILQIFPTAFSTFFQALHQTKVAFQFFPWVKNKSSWTLFVPGNVAFAKIPLGINAFLFSPRGRRILTKLVEYHISPNHTFYTDSIWSSSHPLAEEDDDISTFPHIPRWKKQHFNTTLPTLIGKNATLRIDEFKLGPIVKIAINHRPGGVIVNDVLAYDGVIQVVDRIILPPRRRCRHGHQGYEHGEEEEEWIEGFAEDDEWTIDNLRRIFDEE